MSKTIHITLELDENDLAMVRELEDSFGITDPWDGKYTVGDAECEPVAECTDPRVAELIRRLFDAVWVEALEDT